MAAQKLGMTLRRQRLALGLTLRDVQSRAVIANGYYSELERGKAANVNPKKLRLLARVLKLDYIQLLLMAGYLTQPELNALHKDCGVC